MTGSRADAFLSSFLRLVVLLVVGGAVFAVLWVVAAWLGLVVFVLLVAAAWWLSGRGRARGAR